MDHRQAFETLLAELNAAIEESLARHAAAAKRGDRDSIEVESERQKNLLDGRDQIQGLKELWDKLVGRRAPVFPPPRRTPPAVGSAQPQPALTRRAEHSRPQRGARTRGQAFIVPILYALKEIGGRGEVSAILKRVGQLMSDTLTEWDRTDLPSGADMRWRNSAQWARLRMKNQGLLADNSPVGVWEITQQGLAYLAQHPDEVARLRAALRYGPPSGAGPT